MSASEQKKNSAQLAIAAEPPTSKSSYCVVHAMLATIWVIHFKLKRSIHIGWYNEYSSADKVSILFTHVFFLPQSISGIKWDLVSHDSVPLVKNQYSNPGVHLKRPDIWDHKQWKWDCPNKRRWLVSLWYHGLICRYEISRNGAKLFSFMNF